METTTSAEALKVKWKNLDSEPARTYTLTQEQINFYNDNGYLVIKELVDFASLYSYKQRFIQFSKGLVSRGNVTVVREPALKVAGAKGEQFINKLQDIAFDDVFGEYIEYPALLNVVRQLIGEDITAMHSMFINKPPGTGRHPSHQDLYYFPFRPAEKIVAAWTAVDHVTRDNGSLYVVPASHKPGQLYKHGNLPDSNKMYHGILSEDEVAPPSSWVHLQMSPGDTVFFHPLLVHGSGPNVTKNYRKSISCHYANSGCEYIEVGDVQLPIAKEVEQEARRRGYNISFADAWKYRSKEIPKPRSHL